MPKQILFLQGAGEGAYKADALLAESLRRELGADYEVIYPAMPDEANAPYDDWKQLIEATLATMQAPVILAGHSVGGSFLLKYLSEAAVKKPVAGVFVMATPFWGGEGWLYEGYQEIELPKDTANTMPPHAPVFLYHSQDDEVVPFEHMTLFKKLLPQATLRQLPHGGHQLDDDLTAVAQDIKNLA